MIVVGLAISLPVCGLLIRWSCARGAFDEPGTEAHKQHTQAVPAVGGVGIFLAVAIPMLAVGGAVWLGPTSWFPQPLQEHLPGLQSQLPALATLLGCLLVMHVVGWIDDCRGLGAGLKLAIQLAVGSVLVIFFDVRILHLLDQFGPLGVLGSVIVSVLWIGLITNAMNMLDNMNGLSAGVGAIIAGIYLAATLVGGQWFVAAMSALLLGGLLGFGVYNFPRAKAFMGDRGSLVIGLLLAVISMRTTYFIPGELAGGFPEGMIGAVEGGGLSGGVSASVSASGGGGWYGLLMPLVLMAVPLYDFFTVIWIRLRLGTSPFRGDCNHFSHRLVRRGLSPVGAVVLIWLCTLATGLGGSMLMTLASWQAAVVAVQVICVLVILAVLEFSSSEAE